MKPDNTEIILKYSEDLKKSKKELEQAFELRDELKKPSHRYSDMIPFDLQMLAKGVRNRQVELEQNISKCYKQIGRYTIKDQA